MRNYLHLLSKMDNEHVENVVPQGVQAMKKKQKKPPGGGI